jgi:hypothetical protein
LNGTRSKNYPLCILIQRACRSQDKPAVHFLHKGNPVLEINQNSDTDGAACPPCTDSFLTLKEKIMSLDNMVFVEENKYDTPSRADEESVA